MLLVSIINFLSVLLLQLSHQVSPCPILCNCTIEGDHRQEAIDCSGADVSHLNISTLTNGTKLILSNVNLNSDASLKSIVKDLPEIKELDLSNNYFTEIPTDAVSTLKNLVRLILSNNSITHLSEEITELSHKMTINLSENPIGCNCTTVNILSKSNRLNIKGNCSFLIENIKLTQLEASTIDCQPCRNKLCLFGTCRVLDAVNFKCICTEGVVGQYCNKVVPKACSNGSLCVNGGTCIANGSSNYTCICPSHVSGIHCQIDDENIIIVAIIVPTTALMLLGIVAYVYFKKIKPMKKQRKSSVSRGRSRKRSVQFDANNIGYIPEDAGDVRGTHRDSTTVEVDKHPHDLNHQIWLSGRRRCSTVLEVEEKMSRHGSVSEGRVS